MFLNVSQPCFSKCDVAAGFPSTLDEELLVLSVSISNMRAPFGLFEDQEDQMCLSVVIFKQVVWRKVFLSFQLKHTWPSQSFKQILCELPFGWN